MHTVPARPSVRRLGSVLTVGAFVAATSVFGVASATAQTSAEVLLRDTNVFEPEQVTVEEGGTVDFRWEGGNTHNVQLDDGRQSDTTSDAGVQFSATFDDAGTVGFTCTIHPTTMNGSVTVVAAESDPAPTPPADDTDDTDADDGVAEDDQDAGTQADDRATEQVEQPSRIDAGTGGERAGLAPWTTLAVVLGMIGLAIPVAVAAARRR